jgi:hypothetical protein
MFRSISNEIKDNFVKNLIFIWYTTDDSEYIYTSVFTMAIYIETYLRQIKTMIMVSPNNSSRTKFDSWRVVYTEAISALHATIWSVRFHNQNANRESCVARPKILCRPTQIEAFQSCFVRLSFLLSNQILRRTTPDSCFA